jgi:hypothetical protein
MTGEQIRALEGRLWKAADELRENSKLTATEYSFTVLGIIFLRHVRYLWANFGLYLNLYFFNLFI